MTQTRQALDAAIADAGRGRRSFEWERVSDDLVVAARAYIEHVEAKRAEAPKGLRQMQDEVTAWCERKGWRGEGSAPVTFGDTMALLHSEVSEALEAFRDWGLRDATAVVARRWICPEDGGQITDSGGRHEPRCIKASCHYKGDGIPDPNPALPKPEGVGSEFADVLIRLLDDCDRWGVDLAFEFERKMAYNEKRPYQRGGRPEPAPIAEVGSALATALNEIERRGLMSRDAQLDRIMATLDAHRLTIVKS